MNMKRFFLIMSMVCLSQTAVHGWGWQSIRSKVEKSVKPAVIEESVDDSVKTVSSITQKVGDVATTAVTDVATAVACINDLMEPMQVTFSYKFDTQANIGIENMSIQFIALDHDCVEPMSYAGTIMTEIYLMKNGKDVTKGLFYFAGHAWSPIVYTNNNKSNFQLYFSCKITGKNTVTITSRPYGYALSGTDTISLEARSKKFSIKNSSKMPVKAYRVKINGTTTYNTPIKRLFFLEPALYTLGHGL